MRRVDSRQSTVDGARPLLAITALASILLVSCKREDDVICDGSTDKWRYVQEASAKQGLRGPVTTDDVAAERSRCMAAVDKLKAGPKDCLGRCYAKASDRDALLECDRTCQVSVQAPP